MKRNRNIFALLAALMLLSSLLAGCGRGRQDDQEPAPAPAENTEPAQPPRTPDAAPADMAPPDQLKAREPADSQGPVDGAQPEGPVPESAPVFAPAETEPEPKPEPGPDPARTVPEDGTYTAAVTLEGGTGRAAIDSPATLYCRDGAFTAVIVWSSSNFDYMKVDGEKYLQTNTEGSSTFEIPVSAFDRKLDVVADTVAMSEPHEVEYTLFFDSSTLQKQ